MEENQRASKNPMEILLRQHYNSDNLHRIAISNLASLENKIERWWETKYKTPIKKYEDHTYEELMIKMLEDFYYKNPEEIQKFWSGDSSEEDWDGRMGHEYESQVKKGLKKFFEKNKVDLSKYQNEDFDDELSDDDILNNLRKSFPSRPIPKSLSEGEFEEEFEV